MPFTYERRVVPFGLQCLGKSDRILGQRSRIGRRRYPESTPIAPGQQTDSGPTANGCDIVFGQLNTLFCQSIQMRRWCIPSMKSDIPPSQVISDDKYDIGWLLVLSPKELESKKKQTSGVELH